MKEVSKQIEIREYQCDECDFRCQHRKVVEEHERVHRQQRCPHFDAEYSFGWKCKRQPERIIRYCKSCGVITKKDISEEHIKQLFDLVQNG